MNVNKQLRIEAPTKLPSVICESAAAIAALALMSGHRVQEEASAIISNPTGKTTIAVIMVLGIELPAKTLAKNSRQKLPLIDPSCRLVKSNHEVIFST